MKRRYFVGGLAAAAGLTACAQENSSECAEGTAGKGEVFNWSMVTSCPPGFPGLGSGADNFARRVGEASGGRLNRVPESPAARRSPWTS